MVVSGLSGAGKTAAAKLFEDLGYTVVETDVPREALYIADEVFVVGTAAEVTPIRSIDRITIGPGRRGPIAVPVCRPGW